MTAAQLKIREWKKCPRKFVADNFGVEPDFWQGEALDALGADFVRFRLALSACAGPGKTAVLAWIGWWFLSCFGEKGEHPKGSAMSVTGQNLKDNLWAEMAKWRSRSAFLLAAFEWTAERIFARHHPATWFLAARSFSKTANAEEQGRTLSGQHSAFVFYLIDESGDIPPAVLRAAEQGLSKCKAGIIVQAGNPTSKEGMLYHSCVNNREQWTVVKITADPDDANRTPRVDIEWAREQIKKYGRDNPWVMAYILGQFPPSSFNALLSVEDVEAAMKRHLREDAYSFAQKRLGIDAARFGDDSWVIFPRQGLASFIPVQMRNPKSHDVSARVAAAKVKWGSEMEFFDDTGGWASGAIDSFRQAGYTPTPINFSGSPIDPRYLNKRAEMWFEMADWVKHGGVLPPVSELVAELTIPTFTFHKGKFQIEEKDQIKTRLGRSPDFADALALTFAMPDMPAAGKSLRGDIGHSGRALTDFDPLAETRETVAA